jgi:hypothetical protein
VSTGIDSEPRGRMNSTTTRAPRGTYRPIASGSASCTLACNRPRVTTSWQTSASARAPCRTRTPSSTLRDPDPLRATCTETVTGSPATPAGSSAASPAASPARTPAASPASARRNAASTPVIRSALSPSR